MVTLQAVLTLLVTVHVWSMLHITSVLKIVASKCPQGEVFLDKEVRVLAQTPGANSRRGATKKREISRTLFSIGVLSLNSEVLCMLL